MIGRGFVVTLDPRLIDAVVEFTGEVASVAHDLAGRGEFDMAERLSDALDRLDAAGG